MIANRRRFLQSLTLGAVGASVAFRPSVFAAAPAAGLPRSTPEAEGIASASIGKFLAGIAREKHELHGLVLARHGRVIAEGWWTPYGPGFNHTLYSMSKSFTSSAVGFAVAEGKLKVTDRVVSFFPQDLPEKVSEKLAAMRVKDLLCMAAGNEKEPTFDMVKQENWVRHFLAAPVAHEPGSVFMYNSAATYMCSAIVHKLTGQRILDYLTPRLFAPLGITGATWEQCPRGINVGGWGLSVPTEALAKFGQLYLQRGQWQGKTILPAAWIEEATSFKIQQPPRGTRPKEKDDWQQGYAYQFWRCQHGAFRGDGAFGQFTVVLPEQDAVLAINAEAGNMQGILDLAWEHLLPAFRAQPLAPDAAAHGELQRTLGALALAFPAGKDTSPNAARVFGKTFSLDANDFGLKSVTLASEAGRVIARFHDAQREHAISAGFGQWQRGETGLLGTPPRLISGGAAKPGTPHKIATAAAWADEQTLELLLRYYETPHHDALALRFEDDRVQITFRNSLIKARNAKDARPMLTGRLS